MSSKEQKDSVIKLYYLSKFFTGLRFFVPIWIIFGKRFFDVSGLGMIDALTFLITVFVDIPSGALADILGRKRIIIFGIILMGLGHSFIGFSNVQWQYVIFGIISSIGASFISGADSALIYDHLKETKKEATFVKVQSFGTFTYRIGIIIAAFLGGSLYNTVPFLPFLLMGLMEFSSAVCWIFIKEPKFDATKFSLTNYIKQIKDGIKEVSHNSYLKPLVLFYTLIGGITFSCFWFFNYAYAADLGFNPNQLSLLFGTTGIAKAIAVLVIGIFYLKFNRKRVFIGFALIMVIFYIPAFFVGTAFAILIITVIESLGAMRIALLDKFINEEINSANRATTLSFVNMLINIFYVLLVGLGSIVAQQRGTNFLYTIFGVISLIIILPLAIYLSRYKRKY